MSILIGINETVIEATGKDLENILQIRKQAEEEAEKQLAKAQAKTAAQAKLAALGLTADDLRALGL